MSAQAAITRAWKVGRYTATLTVPASITAGLMQAVIEWTPQAPNRLTQRELQEYRRLRNKALAEISAELGIKTAVIDL